MADRRIEMISKLITEDPTMAAGRLLTENENESQIKARVSLSDETEAVVTYAFNYMIVGNPSPASRFEPAEHPEIDIMSVDINAISDLQGNPISPTSRMLKEIENYFWEYVADKAKEREAAAIHDNL